MANAKILEWYRQINLGEGPSEFIVLRFLTSNLRYIPILPSKYPQVIFKMTEEPFFFYKNE